MNRFTTISNVITNEPYALVVLTSEHIKVFPLSESSSEWAQWANESCKSLDEVNESLNYSLQAEVPISFSHERLESCKSLIPEDIYAEVESFASFSQIELVDAVGGHGRRYAVKHLSDFEVLDSPTSLPLQEIAPSSRQSVINYKAMSFRAESTFSEISFEMKKSRALWDPDLGPSGGWRCPPGSQFGGYITDRFGRGCGGGALRRVGRALINAGRGIDKLGARRQARRLNRAAERAQRGENRRERIGAAARRGVGNVANALERGAQRLVGDYDPRDYDPRSGRMRRRGIDAPEIGRERRNAINSRLIEIRDELDDIADKPRTPGNLRRENELIEENRRLRRERDGASPVRRARTTPAPSRRRVVKPAAGERRQRQQGARPTRKPVAERGRENWRERLARRLVGEYKPDEYKPGDKKRIKNRKNRYADVSDANLRRALANRSPKRARPGEKRDVEARRRQERLEILQEMLNRGMDIPEQYKREVRQYRLKPQRQKRRDGELGRVGRAAVGLERAAQRVERPRKPRTARNRREDRDVPNVGRRREERDTPRVNVVEARQRNLREQDERLRREKAEAKKKRPEGVSDKDWKDYKDYVDSLENSYGYGGNDRLARVDSYDVWAKRNNRNVPDGADKPDTPIESNRPTPRPRTDIPSNRPTLTRERRRRAVTDRTNESSLRRPMPKKIKGDTFDMDGLDRDQKLRMRNLLKDEKARLDAEWRKRLGLRSDEAITDKAIKAYIKEREGNKPQAYIGTLKAKANDWKVLSEWQKQIDDRPPGANLIGENDALNRIGPKRRGDVIKNFNAGVPAISRSGRNTDAPKAPSRRIVSRRPEATLDKERVSASIAETINESIGGSMPDDRSRRNVRNRFPNNGLPEKAFWRESGWVGRDDNDRANHERRFGRYYDSNGKLNARGRLVNRQLKQERDEANGIQQEISKRASEVAKSGKRSRKTPSDSPKVKNPVEVAKGLERFKQRDGALKADEVRLREKYRVLSDSQELAEDLRRYANDAKSADDTIVFMVNNGRFEGADGDILAENLAYFEHAERMRQIVAERLESVDPERAKRLMKELDGKVSSIQTPRPKTSPLAPRDNMDVALAKIKARRFGAGQFGDIKKRAIYKENLRRWRGELDKEFEDLKVLVDRGLPMNARMAMAEQFGRVDDFDLLPDDQVNWANLSETEARIEHIEKIQALLRGTSIPKRRTTGQSRRSSTPQPGSAPAQVSPNAGKHLVVGTPRKRVSGLPVFGNDGTPDSPMPTGTPIVNSQIQSADDAIQWLNDGKSLSEVPHEYWLEALDAHANIPGGKKQFIEVAKNGGIIGETRIFVALGPDGKPSGQGLVLKDDVRDGSGQSNINEVLGVNLFNALGMQMDPATFDGMGSRGVPISVIPFAWNRAPEGDIITPEVEGLTYIYDSSVIPNFDPRQFDDLDDKALPIRLQAVLGNYVLGVPDRHLQNHMGAMIDGRPMVVPIDLGWAGQDYNDDFFDYVADFDAEFAEGDFGAARNLLQQITDHLSSLSSDQRAIQVSALTDIVDQTIERLEKIRSLGGDKFVEDLLSSVDRARVGDATWNGMVRSAEQQYSHIMEKLSNLIADRDAIVRRWS